MTGWPHWLTIRPVAHRGLHGRPSGCLENTTAAAAAAMAAGYGIECDVQLTRDGEAIVFHDDTLDRLCRAEGPVRDRTAAELGCIAYRDAPDQAMPTLASFLDAIGARVPVLVEIKSRFDGDLSLARRVAAIVADAPANVALMSFDDDVVAALGDLAPTRPRGIVAQADYDEEEWDGLPTARRSRLSGLLHLDRSRPDFLAWRVRDLPSPPTTVARHLGMPVLAWTVRTTAERERAADGADQMIFEGFRP
ncbi:glycerophosphodiester phosphodiesterase family protein [Chelatococcus reniformis]|uniref:Glycerophosphoryl diester phosphodiesterase n=1 Tax=Chelatococcus reniformis TaxID=1494448 RepID=A0A916XAY1_9HYPH|nr:glycerophosphodiester phosphodiesterase family protein [Chelatococcus reniformis]GGC57375.1 glycerophosphoryl diester phosphodiesterase [Chelatococcus reniformis]